MLRRPKLAIHIGINSDRETIKMNEQQQQPIKKSHKMDVIK